MLNERDQQAARRAAEGPDGLRNEARSPPDTLTPMSVEPRPADAQQQKERAPVAANVNVVDVTRSTPQFHADPRIIWAAERTALAWIRTALGLIAFGFVLARAPAFFAAGAFAAASGSVVLPLCGLALIATGAAIAVNSSTRYLRTFSRLARGESADYAPRAPLAVAAIVAAFALALAIWVAAAVV